jgi:hypothetical protein
VLALPLDLRSEIHKFQMVEFAREFFREHRSGGRFSRHVVPLDTLSQWQSTPIREPLLKSLVSRLFKPAAEIFKSILAYSGAEGSAQAGSIAFIVKILGLIEKEDALRDETYVELIKQTRENPQPDGLYRTWEIFLAVASVFPSTRNSEECIKSHLTSNSHHREARIAEIVQFIFIRFSARCALGKPVEGPFDAPAVSRLITSHLQTQAEFGASLHEQIWCQRKQYPRLPIPLMMHHRAEAIFENGGVRMEGIFRLPGNMKKVGELRLTVSQGPSGLAGALIHDLGSLFKSWFGSLPEPIVDKDLVEKLTTAHGKRTFIPFADELPALPQITLKYLIGFLKRMAVSAAVTKMGAPNLAMVFAPNIVDMSATIDPMQVARLSETSKEFLLALINEWDISEIYPLSQELLGQEP